MAKNEEIKKEGRSLGKQFSMIKRPRITEKATILNEQSVYVFDVDKRANKHEVKKAFELMYKVKPLKVGITSVPNKTIMVKGKKGIKSGGKKAFIYLKKGQKIEVI